MIARAVIAAAIAGAACGGPAREGSNDVGRAKMSDGTMVHVQYASESPGRPPLVRIFVDATLVNGAAEPRWFALPTIAHAQPTAPAGGVTGGSPLRMTGARGTAILVPFLGTGAVQAVLIPAGGTVRIRHLELELWDDRPSAPIALPVTIARDLRVGDRPVRAWLSVDPTSDRDADVDRTEALPSFAVPGAREVPLAFVDPIALTVALALPARGTIEDSGP